MYFKVNPPGVRARNLFLLILFLDLWASRFTIIVTPGFFVLSAAKTGFDSRKLF
jgi:hypothetical protein